MELYTFDELAFELAEDKNLRILFVEGRGDVALWHAIVPTQDRHGCEIMSADVITSKAGGNRDKLIKLSQNFGKSGAEDRVLCFIDADNDYILGHKSAGRIVMTDFRDVEAYVLLPECLDRFSLIIMAHERSKASIALNSVDSVARPLGLLRAFSEEEQLHLSFGTLIENKLARYCEDSITCINLKLKAVATTLFQNKGISLALLDQYLAKFSSFTEKHSDLPLAKVVQGKDVAACIAILFNIDKDQVLRHVRSALAISLEALRRFPQISSVEEWVRAES